MHIAAVHEIVIAQHIIQASAQRIPGIHTVGQGLKKGIDRPDVQKHISHADHAIPGLPHNQNVGAEGSDTADELKKSLKHADLFSILPEFVLDFSGVCTFFPEQVLHMKNPDIQRGFQRMDKACIIDAQRLRSLRLFQKRSSQLSGTCSHPVSGDQHHERRQDQKRNSLPGCKKILIFIVHAREQEDQKDQSRQRVQPHLYQIINLDEMPAYIRPMRLSHPADFVQVFLFFIFLIFHTECLVCRSLPYRIPTALRDHLQRVPARFRGQSAHKGQTEHPEKLLHGILQPPRQHPVQYPRIADHMHEGHHAGCRRSQQENDVDFLMLHLSHIQKTGHFSDEFSDSHVQPSPSSCACLA